MLFTKGIGNKIICFDLEGPLSPTDFAFELMKLVPRGDRIFAVISRYDDILTLEEREGYEPGDALKLITPFLIRNEITEDHIKIISQKTTLVKGAEELIKVLGRERWKIYINSTSYRQHAINMARRLGVDWRNVFSTEFPLDKFRKDFKGKKLSLVEVAEIYIAKFLFSKNLNSGEKDSEIKTYLDYFYWPLSGKLEEMMNEIKVNGGTKKTESLKDICEREKAEFQDIIVIGDSITDFKMLKAVKESGGLAIAFNANEYALPYAVFGVASTNLKDIKLVLDSWQENKAGRTEKLKDLVKKNHDMYQWLEGKTLNELKKEGIVKLHKKSRYLVRREAAKLG